MKVFFLLLAIGGISTLIASPLLETSLLILLLSPIINFLIGSVISPGFVSSLLAILISCGIVSIFLGRRRASRPNSADLLPFLILPVTFLFCYSLSLSWPDFFPNGGTL